MTQNRPPLTGVLADIARVAGRDAAEAIARKLGGTRVYFPAKPRPDHWLSELIGQDKAAAVGDELTGGFSGGVRHDIPTGAFGALESLRAKADRMILEGKSERDIALATRYTDRTVRRRKAALRDAENSAQADLFKD